MLRWLKQIFRGKPQRRERASPPPIIKRKPKPSKRGSLPPIILDRPACPYCGVIQDPPPTRRRKCRDCGETIHTRTDRKKRRKYLLTADQAKQRDREEAERKAAEQVEAERRKKQAEREARRQRDIQWKELSKIAQKAMRARDWHTLSDVYRQQAYILFAEGRPHHDVAVEAQRFNLMHLHDLGIPAVRVMTSRDGRVCDYCAPLDGKVFSVEEALEQMPLPSSSCVDGSHENAHGGRCRCVYRAMIPGVDDRG